VAEVPDFLDFVRGRLKALGKPPRWLGGQIGRDKTLFADLLSTAEKRRPRPVPDPQTLRPVAGALGATYGEVLAMAWRLTVEDARQLKAAFVAWGFDWDEASADAPFDLGGLTDEDVEDVRRYVSLVRARRAAIRAATAPTGGVPGPG
jgi:hypothetical protein